MVFDNALRLIEQYDMLSPGCGVLCAVSGGADSVCLLHWLKNLRACLPFTLTAAHFNHNLRGAESDRDEQFVRDFVRGWCGAERVVHADGTEEVIPPVELIVGSGDVAAEAQRRRQGLEEAARELRYAFLRETAEKIGADVIATAHTADDNAETVLLHLARGTGLRGLTGIPPRRGDLIRPLLTTTRAEVLEYLRLYGVPHIEDSTNFDETYARNRVRHQIMPVLEGLYPGFAGRLAEDIPRLRADEDYLTAQAEKIAARALQEGDTLTLPAAVIGEAPSPLAVRAVRILIGRLNGGDQDCAAAHLEAVLDICRGTDPSAETHLPYGLTARREYENLVLTRESVPVSCPETALPLPGETDLGLFRITVRREVYGGQRQGPWDFWLSGGLTELSARPRRTGDILKRPGRPARTLKKLMIDEKIPKHLRNSLPVLESGGQIAAAAGLGIDEAFLPAPGGAVWHIALTRK